MITNAITIFDELQGPVPYIDLKNIKNIPELVIDKFGETDFQKVVQRNVERDIIGKEAALLSIVDKCIINRMRTNIDVSVVATPSGGVTVSYPANAGGGKSSERGPIKNKSTTLHRLDRAEYSYVVSQESKIIGEMSEIQADYLIETNEQMSAKIDETVIKGLNSSVIADNIAGAADVWGGTNGDPAQDISTAIKNIIENSAVDPNRGSLRADTPRWTVILPIGVYDKLNDIVVIDQSRQTIGDFISRKYDVQFVYSRQPFDFEGTWPISTDALLIPSFDRKVGVYNNFDGGGRVPNMYTTEDAEGTHVTGNWWMNYIITPDEKDADPAKSRRVAKITDIAA